jgi:hypothetical protein
MMTMVAFGGIFLRGTERSDVGAPGYLSPGHAGQSSTNGYMSINGINTVEQVVINSPVVNSRLTIRVS